MPSRLHALFLLISLLLALVPPACAGDPTIRENWPAWRGPRGDGSSRETGLPLKWSSTENVAWKVKLPGAGYSSPVIWDERIFLTWCLEDAPGKDKPRVLACLDRASGKLLWEKIVLSAPLEDKHRLNSYASATPATDGRHVWVAFLEPPKMVVTCYDIDGNEVWRRSPGKLLSKHGFCSSPVLYQDLVLLNGDQDADAYLVAYEKATGKERWRIDRPNKTRSYCAPIIVEAAGKTQMVLSGSKSVASYDPATGKQHWLIDGPTEQYVASLVHADGLFFLTTGFPEFHLMGIRPDGTGNITDSKHIAWHHKQRPEREAAYVPSPVAHAGHFFVVSDKGYLSCFEAKTGKRLWMEKLGRRHSASIVTAEGRLYVPADEGDVYVVAAGPKFELLATNSLDEEVYASPAVAQGQLFIRGVQHLFCIGSPSSSKK
jgi:outer membrane protein assembly factor BamB